MGKPPYQPDYERILLALQEIYCFARAPHPLTRTQRRLFRRVTPHLIADYDIRRLAPSPPPEPKKHPKLSPREIEVAWGICGGKTNPEIAEAFGREICTVACHVASLRRKFGVKNRAAIVQPFLAFLRQAKS